MNKLSIPPISRTILIILNTLHVSREMLKIEYLERTVFKVNAVPRWQYPE